MKVALKSFFCIILCMALISSKAQGSAEQERLESINTKIPLKKVKETFEKIRANDRLLGKLSRSELIELPLGFGQRITNNTSYLLAVSEVKVHPEYAELTVFAQVDIPQGETLFFGATGVKLSNEGGIIGDAKLHLLGDVPILIKKGKTGGDTKLTLLGGFDRSTRDTENLTYVTIDCENVKELGLAAELSFSRSILLPYANNQPTEGHVTATFKTVIQDWNDLLVDLDFSQQFVATDYPDLAWSMKHAVFDFSDLKNSANMKFPPKYEEQFIEGQKELWRGVYIEEVDVLLPEEFAKRDKKERVRVGARGLLIDGSGVSGDVFATHVMSLKEGVAGGDNGKWALSVDSIALGLRANHLMSGTISGAILLPVSEKTETAALAYHGIVKPEEKEYQLTISTEDSLNFDVFVAKGKLYENSFVDLKVKDRRFMPKATLWGELHVGGEKAKGADFKGIEFRELTLQTESPKFTAEYFGYNGEVKLGNFPVTISEIGLVSEKGDIGLNIGIDVNLTKTDLGIAAGGVFQVLGNLEDEEGLDSWEFDRVEVSELCVDYKGAFEISGCIQVFENDPVYGKGYSGNVIFTPGIKDLKVEADVMFGKKDYRFFYVDLFATFPKALPVVGALSINGIGGGLYHHMEFSGIGKRGDGSDLGATSSGIVYEPSHPTFLGLRAAVGLELTGNPATLNGRAGFNMEFNRHGGVNKVSFMGEVALLDPVMLMSEVGLTEGLGDVVSGKLGEQLEGQVGEKLQEKIEQRVEKKIDKMVAQVSAKNTAIISAGTYIMMDFENGVLHGEMEVFVKGGFIEGSGPNGRACHSAMHFEKDYWYFFLGKPSDPMGLKVGVGKASAQFSSYFMAGHKLEPSPPLPVRVADGLGVKADVLDYMRDENKITSGKGVVFGSRFAMDTDDLKFLIFYARFAAGTGFDITLRDYGNAQCKGASGPIGIDGWYASGQAYAYLEGELGMRVRIFFKKKNVVICKAGLTALLQAKLPNPIWMRGYVAGHYNILSGLVKGKFRMKVTLGEECEFMSASPLEGMPVIADINPVDNDTNVDVFAAPQVAFNYPIGRKFQFEGDGGVESYQIKLERFKVLNKGAELAGDIEWNSTQDALTFYSFDILPPKTQLKIEVAVSFLEEERGNWKVFTDNNGNKIQEERLTVFTTGAAPDSIPIRNIDFLYPVLGQNHYYPKEHPKGMVRLKRGQPYLFDEGTGWTQRLQFVGGEKATKEVNVSYSQAQREVQFDLPDLSNGQGFMYSLVNLPPKDNPDAPSPAEVYTSKQLGEDATAEMKQNKASTGQNKKIRELSILKYEFRTSIYDTFSEKVRKLKITGPVWDIIYSDVHALQAVLSDFKEPFDPLELSGSQYTQNKPLVTVEAILDDRYFTDLINPLIYKDYPVSYNRNISILGAPPVKAVEILSWYKTYTEKGVEQQLTTSYLPFRYNLPYYYKKDFINLQYKVVNNYIERSLQPKYQYIIQRVFPAISYGTYKTKMQYTLPGGTKGTSGEFKFKNIVK